MWQIYITYCIYFAERWKISDLTNIAFALESPSWASLVNVYRARNRPSGLSLLFQDESWHMPLAQRE